jgi:hypothetical protein
MAASSRVQPFDQLLARGRGKATGGIALAFGAMRGPVKLASPPPVFVCSIQAPMASR